MCSVYVCECTSSSYMGNYITVIDFEAVAIVIFFCRYWCLVFVFVNVLHHHICGITLPSLVVKQLQFCFFCMCWYLVFACVNVRHHHIRGITLPSLISKQLQLLFFFCRRWCLVGVFANVRHHHIYIISLHSLISKHLHLLFFFSVLMFSVCGCECTSSSYMRTYITFIDI